MSAQSFVGNTGASALRKGNDALTNEPAITIGALGALVNAGLFLLFSFVPKVTDDQQTAILAFAAAAVPLIGAVFCRGRVSSVAATKSAPASASETTADAATETATAPASAG